MNIFPSPSLFSFWNKIKFTFRILLLLKTWSHESDKYIFSSSHTYYMSIHMLLHRKITFAASSINEHSVNSQTNIKGHANFFFVDYWWLSIPLSQFNVVKLPPYEFVRHSAHASTLLYTKGYTMYQIDKQTVRDNRKGRNTVPQEDELMVKDPAGLSPRFFLFGSHFGVNSKQITEMLNSIFKISCRN